MDTTPPEIERAWATPSALWPANSTLVAVTVQALLVDICDAAPTFRIVAVGCNEPVIAPGGSRAPDWQITGDHRLLLLRAARAGSHSDRIYAITIRAIDASGNAATATVFVTVPRVQPRR